eukprot:6207412-Pleurochrysis_carterae.AAC.8
MQGKAALYITPPPFEMPTALLLARLLVAFLLDSRLLDGRLHVARLHAFGAYHLGVHNLVARQVHQFEAVTPSALTSQIHVQAHPPLLLFPPFEMRANNLTSFV